MPVIDAISASCRRRRVARCPAAAVAMAALLSVQSCTKEQPPPGHTAR